MNWKGVPLSALLRGEPKGGLTRAGRPCYEGGTDIRVCAFSTGKNACATLGGWARCPCYEWVFRTTSHGVEMFVRRSKGGGENSSPKRKPLLQKVNLNLVLLTPLNCPLPTALNLPTALLILFQSLIGRLRTWVMRIREASSNEVSIPHR